MNYEGLPDSLSASAESMYASMWAPWEDSLPAFRMAPHLYSVAGSNYLAVYLLDTARGLVLIDSGFQESLFWTMANIKTAYTSPLSTMTLLQPPWTKATLRFTFMRSRNTVKAELRAPFGKRSRLPPRLSANMRPSTLAILKSGPVKT